MQIRKDLSLDISGLRLEMERWGDFKKLVGQKLALVRLIKDLKEKQAATNKLREEEMKSKVEEFVSHCMNLWDRFNKQIELNQQLQTEVASLKNQLSVSGNFEALL